MVGAVSSAVRTYAAALSSYMDKVYELCVNEYPLQSTGTYMMNHGLSTLLIKTQSTHAAGEIGQFEVCAA